MTKGWVGFDYDGTIRRMTDDQPVPEMIARIKAFLSVGVEVRICTARICSKYPESHREAHTKAIQNWCVEHIGQALPVTSEKDYDMVVLFDDRAIAVQTDTGQCKGWIETVEVPVA
jgi:hypothetical protein